MRHCTTAPGGIQIIGGGSGIAELANLDPAKCESFIASLSELDSLADVIVIDTGAGLARNTLAFLNAVEEIVVVTTPEPTAITDAYATIKVSSIENPNAPPDAGGQHGAVGSGGRGSCQPIGYDCAAVFGCGVGASRHDPDGQQCRQGGTNTAAVDAESAAFRGGAGNSAHCGAAWLSPLKPIRRRAA